MILAKFFRRDDSGEPARALYLALVAKAREPAFYAALGVPDTVDGRFDMVVVHAMLVLRRLRGRGADKLGEALLELLFQDMDRSLREMGVGDMGIGKHIKRMAKAFFGRAATYESGLDGDDALLRQALTENLYRHGAPAPEAIKTLADYIKRMDIRLGAQETSALCAGRVDFDVAVQG